MKSSATMGFVYRSSDRYVHCVSNIIKVFKTPCIWRISHSRMHVLPSGHRDGSSYQRDSCPLYCLQNAVSCINFTVRPGLFVGVGMTCFAFLTMFTFLNWQALTIGATLVWGVDCLYPFRGFCFLGKCCLRS